MNRGEPRPPSVPGPSAARGTCTLGGLKMQKGKLVKYEKESHYENIADNSDSDWKQNKHKIYVKTLKGTSAKNEMWCFLRLN